ncbi:MAG: rhodanese-like domain-containing protein [Lacunisphaera sp.]|nr:rhodanese-like domain-containing protein [Lacunisphaera sp.]
MKLCLLLCSLLVSFITGCAAGVPPLTPAEAAKLVAAGSAVLVDVREPAEWAATGVAAPAVLLPKSDFDGAQQQWKEFLEKTGDQQIILYCRSGNRSGQVAKVLAAQGRNVANAGAFKDWQAAGLPVRQITVEKP